MRALKQPYSEIMRMPSGRRGRFAEENQHIDEYLRQRQSE